MLQAKITQAGKSKTLFSEEYIPKAMPRVLGTFDLTATLVLTMFALSSSPTAAAGGPSAFMYWFMGAIAFLIPCAIVSAQLGSAFPHEGSLYNWTHKTFGPFWGLFAGVCDWVAGPLVATGLGVAFVQMLQGFQSEWLQQPWQQGIVILAIILATTYLASQRLQTVQKVIRVIFIAEIIGIAILFIAGLAWLIMRQPVATDFSRILDFSTLTPDTFNLYGLIVFAYIGSNLPLNMAGEIREQDMKNIARHQFWGSLILCLGYLISIFAILVVQGQKAGYLTFAMIDTVYIVFGKVIGGIAAILFLSSIIGATTQYHYIYARILLVAGIDQRLPTWFGQLNKHRVPIHATFTQGLCACVFTIFAFFIVPYIIPSGDPTALSSNVYFVSQASATLIWIISILFLFVNISCLLIFQRRTFLRHLKFPEPVLWVCSIIGSITIILGIINTLYYSWLPGNIPNDQWWWIVAGITVLVIALAMIFSMIATSEAGWQEMTERDR